MRGIILAAAVVAASGLVAQPARAQVQLGGQASWADDAELGVGARLQADIGSWIAPGDSPLSRLTGALSFDFFPGYDCGPADCTYLELNGNALYPLAGRTDFAPYVGAGVNVGHATAENAAYSDDATEVGLNLLTGGSLDLGALTAFAEVRFEVGGGEQLVITLGALLGRRH